ncbi:MAG: SPFH domain-containing protein [Flavobacteriales bacterium]|jgi:regulator of protease activity HflC (stomatin/prohibitin superfamily)|tara:strand:- start:12058 stop:13041 length:984 start_codon:yes stop_codon:yes gene_type:complete
MALTIISVLIAILVIVFVLQGIKIVQQSETIIIERLGKYQSTLKSGLNIIIPFIDKPREILWRYSTEGPLGNVLIKYVKENRIDLREAVYDFPKQNVITRDNIVTEINALIYFQIMDPIRAVYEIANLPQAIEKLTQTSLRNVIGEMDLDDTLSSRDTINTKLQEILDDATNKWGVKVNRVELQDINPPMDIREAMEKQMRAERDKRATILEAEGTKQALVLEAQGKRDADISIAEGERRSTILVAEGDAAARVAVANAEAEAIKVVTAAIDKTGDPVNYLIAMKYLESLKEMTSGKDNKVVYMPYEATGILSSVGGIKDLLTHKGA